MLIVCLELQLLHFEGRVSKLTQLLVNDYYSFKLEIVVARKEEEKEGEKEKEGGATCYAGALSLNNQVCSNKSFYHGLQEAHQGCFCADKSGKRNYVLIKFQDNDGDQDKDWLTRLLSVSVLQGRPVAVQFGIPVVCLRR